VSQAYRIAALCVFAIALTALPGSAHRDFNRQRADDASLRAHPVGITRREFVRSSDHWGERRLAVTIWYPTVAQSSSQEPIPDAEPVPGEFRLVIYSHGGCGGQPQSIAPLAIAVAREGFAFAQFPHPGSMKDDCVESGERYTQALLERPDDIRFVLDALGKLRRDRSWRLRSSLNTDRVGLLGHSQGGQTALMLPASDSRVRATVSISPSVAHPDTPVSVWQAIQRLRVPVMIIHGRQDPLWTSEGPRRAYESLPPDTPRAYLEVDGMGHTPTTPEQVALIVRYTTAMFKYYLEDDRAARGALLPSAAPSNVTFTSSRFPS
jgi:pimeloyl-ACP methyl ester carboxylesterase